jgi:transposase-like protein
MCESLQGFVPPFCPNPHCRYHRDSAGWRFKRDGTHFRRCDQRRVQRYRCSRCRRSFSTQTFSTTYWLKRPDLLAPLLRLSLACAGFRQLARALCVAPSTVALQLGRAGRHATLFHERHRPRTNPQEPLVLDGFETFEKGQYWPTHLNTVVGAESWFVYATTVSELRRKGRMRPDQRKRRAELETRYGRPPPRDIARGCREALALALPERGTACLRSDDHRQYPPAIRGLPGREIRHEVTSSKQPRTSRNPLFPVNLYHGLLRHDGGNHKRETIGFSKRNQSMLWREAIHRVWRNWVKQVSERRGRGTPAMRLGLTKRPMGWDEILVERLFPTRIALPDVVARSYFGRIPTRSIPGWRAHTLRYAM